MGPRKDRQTKIDGRRVERIDRVGEVETQILVDLQSPRLADQSLGQLRVNAPVARLVGIGQRRAPHRIAEAHGIELAFFRLRAGIRKRSWESAQKSYQKNPTKMLISN
jgi:hypothetical protein